MKLKRSVRIEKITPAKAEKYLAKSKNFRRLNISRCKQLARDMASGWDFNGASLVFDGAGFLVDGQHRLEACISSGRPFETVVVRGIKQRAVPTMDGVWSRGMAQHLSNMGEKNTRNLGAGLRLVWKARHDNLGSKGREVDPTIREMLALLKSVPGIREGANLATVKCLKQILPGSVITALHFLFSEIDPEMAADFFVALRGEQDLPFNDPVFVLKNVLTTMALDRKNKHTHPSTEHIMGLCIKAWNKWRNDETVKRISFRQTGKNAEKFPVINK